MFSRTTGEVSTGRRCRTAARGTRPAPAATARRDRRRGPWPSSPDRTSVAPPARQARADRAELGRRAAVRGVGVGDGPHDAVVEPITASDHLVIGVSDSTSNTTSSSRSAARAAFTCTSGLGNANGSHGGTTGRGGRTAPVTRRAAASARATVRSRRRGPTPRRPRRAVRGATTRSTRPPTESRPAPARGAGDPLLQQPDRQSAHRDRGADEHDTARSSSVSSTVTASTSSGPTIGTPGWWTQRSNEAPSMVPHHASANGATRSSGVRSVGVTRRAGRPTTS